MALASVLFSIPGFADHMEGELAKHPLTRAAYLLEVTGYCSLLDTAVASGFAIERDRLIETLNMDQASIEKSRMKAWNMAYAEWDNRGLGGFRKWCKTEGQEAAAYFRSLARDNSQ